MVRFGPAGLADSFKTKGYKKSIQVADYLSQYGLNAFEYQCGRGVKISTGSARELGGVLAEKNIQVSLHAPYFISMSSVEEEKRLNSVNYILQSATALDAMGGRRVIFHSGSCARLTRRQALDKALDTMHLMMQAVDDAGLGHMVLCPETMGKVNQLGSLEEVIELCNVDERIWPTIDFGHLHCRGLGAINSKEDYAAILDKLENGIGTERAKTMHVHFSRIEYTKGGEKMHHTFADVQYGPEFMPLAELIAERGYEPVFICESKGTMAEDAKSMKDMYFSAINSLLK